MVTRTDGPFEYWVVTSDAVRATAEAPGTNAAAIQSLAGELEGDEKNAAGAIEGDIEAGVKANTAAARDTATRLASKGTYAVGLLGLFATDVDTFDTTVNQINLDYQNQVQTNISTARTKASKEAKGDDAPVPVDTGAIAASVKASMVPRYQKAESIIDDAADGVASMFKQGPTDANVKDLLLAGLIPFGSAGLYPTVVLTDDEKRQALSNTVKGMTPAAQAQYVKDHKDIDPKLANVISPEAQQILANDVADDVKNKTVDAETVRLLGLLQDQPAFAQAFYGKVTPDQMAEAISNLSSDAYPNGPMHAGVSSSGGTEVLDKDKIELYKNFLAAAGGTLATYSKGGNADGIAWGKAITDEDHPQNAGALSLLLREGGDTHEFDGKFLSDVGDTVYKYEREHENDQPWGSRGSQVIDPDAKIGNSDDNYWGVRSSDAMANVLGSMKNSPDAAQMFFADGYPDKDGEPDLSVKNDRLEYLMTERTWAKDLADTKGGDEGDGLGLALEAATLGDRSDSSLSLNGGTTGRHDEIGAALATQTLQIVADKSGTDGGFMQDEWHTWPGMRDSLGAIAGGHINDVFDIAATDGRTADGSPFYPGPPAGLNLSAEDLGKVISEIGRGDDKTGLEILTTSAVNYNNQLTSSYLSNHDGEPKTIDELRDSGVLDDLSDQASKTGHGLNFIFEHGLEGGLDDEHGKEERAKILSKALDIGTSFIPTPPGGKLIEVLTSEGTDWIKGQLTNTPSSGSSADANKAMTGDMKGNLEFGTYNALIQNGYLNQDTDPRYGIPSSALDPNNPQRIDPLLHNSQAGDVDRDGNGVDPATGKKLSAEDEYAYWKSGPHPEEQKEEEYNGPPSTIFQNYLNAYAGAAYGTEPK